MAKQTIALGTAPTGVGGDTPRSAFTKTQANIDELYAFLAATGSPSALPAVLTASKLAAPAMVGTVSQSGGVPTGALMEYISSAAGEAWKFACGLMICTRTIYSAGTPMTSALGSLFYYPSLPRFSFAATFAATPDVKVTIRSYGPLIWAINGNSEATTTQGPAIYPVCVAPVTSDIDIHQLAIGRWF